MTPICPRPGKEVFLAQLAECGVRYVFGNPGTTEQGLVDALQDRTDLEFVLCLHEGVAVGAAEGWARASGAPAFVLLHTAPGLGNALGMLVNASLGRTPMVVFVGDMPRAGRLQEPALSGPIADLARPVARWVHELDGADEIPQVLTRAFKVAAQEPKGPVVLVVPHDVMDDLTPATVLPMTRPARALLPDEAVLKSTADLIAGAQRPALLVADGVAAAGAQEEVARLAEVLGAPIHLGYATEGCLPANHPLDAGALPLFSPDGIHATLQRYDCLVAVGSEVLKQAFPRPGLPVPASTAVVQVGEDPWELGKNLPTTALQADPVATVAALTALVEQRLDPEVARSRAEQETERIRVRRADQHAAALATWDRMPMSPARAVAEVVRALPQNACVVDESVSASPWLTHFHAAWPGRWFRSRGGGLGAGMALPLGLQLASTDPVFAFVGDGAAMYTATALWTAAHLDLPVTWVVLNNRSYRMLKLNVLDYLGDRAGGRAFVAADLEDPPVDFVGLAASLGVPALRAETPDEIAAAMRARQQHPGPFLVEVAVDPSVPRLAASDDGAVR